MELTEQLTVVVQSNRDGGAIINFRIIEFNFKNNEQYNDERDKEIIINLIHVMKNKSDLIQ